MKQKKTPKTVIRLVIIGGVADGEIADVPNELEIIKLHESLTNHKWINEPIDKKIIKEDLYQRLDIEGVKVLALKSMKKSDVVHTLINSYLKR